MINLLIGAPGGGKSYEAVVYHVLPALKAGRKVITNLPLSVEMFERLDGDFPGLIELRAETKADRPDVSESGAPVSRFLSRLKTGFNKYPFSAACDYGDLWRHPETKTGPLYVIDECHIALPKIGTPIEVEEWYSLHRHESADVLLITQSYGKINAAVRDLVQICYRVRKNVAFGSDKSYTRKVQDGIRGEVVNTSIRRYEKRFFSLYNSYTKGGGQELQANDITPLWQRWPFIGVAICILLTVGLLTFGPSANIWKVPEAKKPPVAASPGSDLVASRAAVAKPPTPDLMAVSVKESPPADGVFPDGPFEGKTIHMVGHMIAGEKVYAIYRIAQNGLDVMDTRLKDLLAVGYGVEVLAPCISRFTWAKKSWWVTCDRGSAGVSVGGHSIHRAPEAVEDLAGGKGSPLAGNQPPAVPRPPSSATM